MGWHNSHFNIHSFGAGARIGRSALANELAGTILSAGAPATHSNNGKHELAGTILNVGRGHIKVFVLKNRNSYVTKKKYKFILVSTAEFWSY